jgi:hypothetical protein
MITRMVCLHAMVTLTGGIFLVAFALPLGHQYDRASCCNPSMSGRTHPDAAITIVERVKNRRLILTGIVFARHF